MPESPAAAPSSSPVKGGTIKAVSTTTVTASKPQAQAPPGSPSADRGDKSPHDELRDLLAENEPKAPTPKPEPEQTPKEQLFDDRREAAAPEQPEKPDQPATERPKPQGGNIKALRDGYESAKKRVAELETELRTVKEANGKTDSAELLSQVEKANKRAEQAENELKFVRYEKSAEYRDKYVTPLEKVFKRAYGDITQLTALNPETGEERRGTKEDFDKLLHLGLGDARKFAKQFGDDAEELMAHRRAILELHEASQEAVQEFKAKGSDREREMSAQSSAAQKRRADAWHQLNQKAQEQYADWFKPVDGDEIGNKLLQFGYGLSDKLFGDHSSMPEADQVKLHSAAYNQLAAFPRMAHRVKTLTARVKELEGIVADYENSGPSGGARRAASSGEAVTDDQGNPLQGEMAVAYKELHDLERRK